jgi:hypothetical protein
MTCGGMPACRPTRHVPASLPTAIDQSTAVGYFGHGRQQSTVYGVRMSQLLLSSIYAVNSNCSVCGAGGEARVAALPIRSTLVTASARGAGSLF